MADWMKWLFARQEMIELERWRAHWGEYRRWLAEFPEVGVALDGLRNSATDTGEGHPAFVRERIRRMKGVPLNGVFIEPTEGAVRQSRLAVAHAAEVAELQRIIREHFSRAEREKTDRFHAESRAEAAERDAREAVGLLRECLPYVDSHAKASHMMDGFRRQPANDHDNLALRVAAAIATTEQADEN